MSETPEEQKQNCMIELMGRNCKTSFCMVLTESEFQLLREIENHSKRISGDSGMPILGVTVNQE